MQNFSCLVLAPGHVGDAALLIAALRGGGVAILDLEHCPPGEFALASRNLRRVLLNLPGTAGGAEAIPGRVGLRLHAGQFDTAAEILELMGDRPHWLIVTGQPTEVMRKAGRRILCEVHHAPQTGDLERSLVDGYLAKGNESGGWVGEEPAFILTQKLIAAGCAPIYVQGGIGPHTASACRAAGAAGVVLDDQLLLMPESPIPSDWRKSLASAAGQDAVLLGEALGQACRVLHRSARGASSALRELAAELSAAGQADQWKSRAQPLIGWGDPEQYAWPVGQAVAYASAYRDRYGSTSRMVNELLRASEESVGLAQALNPLAPGSPLAQSHRTRYPILQGPMTRVSDTADFAEAVARGGALPFLALALMEGTRAARLLEETRDRVAGLPWGAGILGFAPEEIRRPQTDAILRTKPPFVLVAGGRPDQAAEFEAAGLTTYIHAPAPTLLKMFIEQGARRFVLEGYECGGHVGPLSSFSLWEGAIRILLAYAPAQEAARMHIVFAGGIHDALSAAMVAAMAAPLAAAGMRIGVLMGTAYLFTREAVESGAVVEGFQIRALGCRDTHILEIGPGHAIRCAASPFTEFFRSEKKRLAEDKVPAAQVSLQLEQLALGRLRIASKGIERDQDTLVTVDDERQQSQGMYMIGLAATMHRELGSIPAVHDAVSRASGELLGALPRPVLWPEPDSSRIAVIGIATLAPRAQYPEQFWRNLLIKLDTITEIPATYWDWKLFYDPDPGAPDKTYSKWGAFLDEVSFDPVRFGIPPKSLKSISPGQLLVLEAVRRALADAGYESGNFDRENTSVILGSDGSSFIHNQYLARSVLPLVSDTPLNTMLDRLPEWTDESFPGILNNVSAGRVANRFDFGGTNFVIDAACASSLKAIELGVQELESGRSNVVVAGGIDIAQSPSSFTAFSKTHALSPRGRAQTFDKAADGIVMSEAVGIVILKRLADAERDGDRIYAVIESVASSSDGKAMGLTAPRPAGQVRACQRAYQRADVHPRTLALYEAHGTGTSVGDAAELDTISSVLAGDGAGRKSCVLGSLKTLIGHAKTAAGVLGLAKACLSVYHKTLPPHYGVDNPLDKIADPETPVCLLREPRPWFTHPDYPRRAGVSAFGFGGTNTHAVLSEYSGNRLASPGANDRPCELIVLRAASAGELAAQARALLNQLASGAAPRLRDLAYSLAERAARRRESTYALAAVCATLDETKESIELACHALDNPQARLPRHIHIAAPADSGKIAFLFPGQGSQYANMARETALYSNEMRAAIEQADLALRDRYPRLLSQYIFPPAAFSDAGETAQVAEIADTHVAQPAIGTISIGMFDLLSAMGIAPDMACGHSYGEFTALAAAGVLARHDFQRLSEARGRWMAEACRKPGAMAVVRIGRDDLAHWLKKFPGVVLANHNSPKQSAISGSAPLVAEAVRVLTAKGIVCSMLPVSGAFHSPLMAESQPELVKALAACDWHTPRFAVYSNTTAAPHPADGPAIRDQLAGHLLSSVEFASSIERMYADGARTFVECGPKHVLTGLTGQILEGRPHTAIAVEGSTGGWRGFLNAAGALFVRSSDCDLLPLFAARDVRLLDLDKLAETTKDSALTPTSWFVNGVRARPKDDHSAPRWGSQPHLDFESATRLRSQPVHGHAPQPSSPTLPEIPPALDPARQGALNALHLHQETMRRFLSVQEEIMKQFLGDAGASAMPAIASAPANGKYAAAPPPQASKPPAAGESKLATIPPAAPATPAPAALDRDSLSQLLLGIVSDRTGYPTEVLGLDMDLEAEIGVDSIKRIEILAALGPALPDGVAAEMRSHMEVLTRVKTLNGLISRVLDLAGSHQESKRPPSSANGVAPRPDPAKQLAAVSPADVPPDAVNTASCPRFVPVGVPATPPSTRDIPIQGLYVVTGEGAASELARLIEREGGAAVRIGSELLLTESAIAKPVLDARRKHGAIRGLIHLAGTESSTMPGSLAAWKRQTQRDVKSLFALLQCCAADLARPNSVALSASSLGGWFGRDHSQFGGVAAGACAGMLKTFATESPECLVKTLDFDPRLPAAAVARIALAEMQSRSGGIETGYSENGAVTFRQAAQPADVASSVPMKIPSDWVWLITGGARGITAEAALAIAQPGATLLVVGRSAQPGLDAAQWSGLARAELRESLLRSARDAGETVSPAQIESRVRQVMAQDEIASNLARLRAAGARVEYHSLDVRDEKAFGALIASAYKRHGNIDAVIHGAGIIEDKLLADKTRSSFDSVFDTKADSAFLLARHLRGETLKLLVFFGSVSGRFGNPGQADYAAANELLNRMGCHLRHSWPSARVVTINWGPWQGSGMANESVRRNLEHRGILPIDRQAGIRFFLDEIRYGEKGQPEIVAGGGPWALTSEPESTLPAGQLHSKDLTADVAGLAEAAGAI